MHIEHRILILGEPKPRQFFTSTDDDYVERVNAVQLRKKFVIKWASFIMF